MLKEIIKKNHYSFFEEALNWEDAIRKSCLAFEKTGVVNEKYYLELIDCVKKFGPYIVIEPGIAMPHSTQEGENVFKTEISFTKFEKSVKFDDENEAVLFFTLASVNPDVHIENIQKLMELLTNDELKEELFKIRNIDELIALSNKYNI